MQLAHKKTTHTHKHTHARFSRPGGAVASPRHNHKRGASASVRETRQFNADVMRRPSAPILGHKLASAGVPPRLSTGTDRALERTERDAHGKRDLNISDFAREGRCSKRESYRLTGFFTSSTTSTSSASNRDACPIDAFL